MAGPRRCLAALLSARLAAAAWAAPAAAQECELAEDDCALLQTTAVLSSRARTASPAVQAPVHEPLEIPNPIRWVHVPKCGTSFLNTLIHLPGTCPGVPPNLEVREVRGAPYGMHPLNVFYALWGKDENCPGLEVQHLYHGGIGSAYGEAKGRLMIFLRQPEQRLISHWNYQDDFGHFPDLKGDNVEEFARQDSTAGCAVKMLARDGGNPCVLPPAVTDDEVVLARQRLREGFAFVGITDEWDLSICLFNRMFNSACSKSQFQNTHPGPTHTVEPYDTAQLNGFHDSYDGALYEEAQAIFRENLALFNVSLESCGPCFREAGLRG